MNTRKIRLYEDFDRDYAKRIEDTYIKANKLSGDKDEVLWFDDKAIDRYIELLQFSTQGDKILDFGCGLGILASVTPAPNYMGVDVQDRFIKKCKEEYPSHNFKTIDNINDIDWTWDWFVASGAFTTGFKDFSMLERTIDKAVEKSSRGVAFNFLVTRHKNQNAIFNYYLSQGVHYNLYNLSKMFQFFKSKYPDLRVVGKRSSASDVYDNEGIIYIIK